MTYHLYSSINSAVTPALFEAASSLPLQANKATFADTCTLWNVIKLEQRKPNENVQYVIDIKTRYGA